MLDDGEVVEALLDQEADDAVGVEYEVRALSVLISDDPAPEWRYSSEYVLPFRLPVPRATAGNLRQEGNQLRGLEEDVHVVKRHVLGYRRSRLLAVRAVVRP